MSAACSAFFAVLLPALLLQAAEPCPLWSPCPHRICKLADMGNQRQQGEHGTGRNVAPYVEMEWGGKAYDLMWRLKELFDPDYVLNPGVVLNRVRTCFWRRVKTQPR